MQNLWFSSGILKEKKKSFNLKLKPTKNAEMHVVTVFLLKQFVEYHMLTFLKKTHNTNYIVASDSMIFQIHF